MNLNPDQLKNIIKQALNEAEPKVGKKTFTLDECVEYTGIGKNKILELAHNQKAGFPVFRVGVKFLVNKDLLDKWLEKITLEGRIL